MNFFIEQRILGAIRGLLTGEVNDILRATEIAMPTLEFCNSGSVNAIVPEITLLSCEMTLKERIIRLEAYSLTVSLTVADRIESEFYCYAYASAICNAMLSNPTLDGVVDMAGVTTKKVIPPKTDGCGEGWSVVLTLRVIVER